MKELFVRCAYLLSRAVVRPERAFAAVSAYNPVIDVTLIGFVGALWIAVLGLPALGREIFSAHAVAQSCFFTALSYAGSIGLMALYAICVSLVSVLFGGPSRWMSTLLCFILSTIVAFSVTALPITVIKLVDFGNSMSDISETIISIGPWVYVFILIYVAVLRIHKTVPQRVIAYMGLALLPIIFLLVLVRSRGSFEIPGLM